MKEAVVSLDGKRAVVPPVAGADVVVAGIAAAAVVVDVVVAVVVAAVAVVEVKQRHHHHRRLAKMHHQNLLQCVSSNVVGQFHRQLGTWAFVDIVSNMPLQIVSVPTGPFWNT